MISVKVSLSIKREIIVITYPDTPITPDRHVSESRHRWWRTSFSSGSIKVKTDVLYYSHSWKHSQMLCTNGLPIVNTVIAHFMPYPANLEVCKICFHGWNKFWTFLTSFSHYCIFSNLQLCMTSSYPHDIVCHRNSPSSLVSQPCCRLDPLFPYPHISNTSVGSLVMCLFTSKQSCCCN